MASLEPFSPRGSSPTTSLASLGDPSLSFYSETSSSTSSLQAATGSQPSTPTYKCWGDETLRHPLYEPGGHLAIESYDTLATNDDLSRISLSPPQKHLDDDMTPSLTQNSTFSNPSFVEFDPNTIYSTHAGRDDDDDSTGYDHCDFTDKSADGYYNNDEHDEEANLNIGWEGSGDGWGCETTASAIPEDGRLKAVSYNIDLRGIAQATDSHMLIVV